MKKLLIAVTVLCFTLNGLLQAQTTKGTFMMGLHSFSPTLFEGSSVVAPTNALGISFGTYRSADNDSKSSYTNIGLSSSAHYFLVDNFSAGINLNFFRQTVKEKGGSNPDKFITTVFLAGPELRYYLPAGVKTKIWLGGNSAWGSTQVKWRTEGEPTKLHSLGGGAGLAIFPSEHFSIDLGLGYNATTAREKYQGINGETINSKNTASGVTFDVGFSVFF